ncbi:MAG: putative glycosyltransferase [Phycisphaerales bacterium]|nr:putative glycosyltransferase [Phycisphaerales bacterium]
MILVGHFTGLRPAMLSGQNLHPCGNSALPPEAERVSADDSARNRVCAHGKLLRLHGERWYIKGLTYGPFAFNDCGNHLPDRAQVRKDLAHISRLGCNAIRLYHLPSPSFLDDASDQNLRVLIDVPWDKHRCFFEDWSSQREALQRITTAARDLGGHPAVFGISVANEIPKDVVRFYGAKRVERFIDSLVDAVKQQAPGCLATYTNYPSTEFLSPTRLDFYCTNVYLEDGDVLGQYLDRLQHIAGGLPLVLGEYGVDSLRASPGRQAELLARHVGRVFHHGLAGSFVFSYTDDWVAGGQRVEDWAFGITDVHRIEKPAAPALSRAWALAPTFEPLSVDATMASPGLDHAGAWAAGLGAQGDLGRVAREPVIPFPRVSVVVCSLNGAATLRECLSSLLRLDYPNYEVILVDDGSTDETPQIVNDFPTVKTIRQENAGLSAARNVGARVATGEVIAYTDSDCVADEAWLLYLVRGLREQGVDAIGGPNIAPASDGWVARCVAASPGGPSHVMLDDRRAEHIPGCNMAFWRDRLAEIGGFDPPFRQAGDDVDICWRFLDAGLTIGYAPAAVVWHHRRATIRGYFLQQKGYGRAEAMLHFKHPRRFNAFGCSRWNGIIYGHGSGQPPAASSSVYHGRFGSGLFQIVYRRNEASLWTYYTLLEWQVLAFLFLSVAPVFPAAVVVAGTMLMLTLLAAARPAARVVLAPDAPWWCRILIGFLHMLQPSVRAWHRYFYRLRYGLLPHSDVLSSAIATPEPGRRDSTETKRISPQTFDLYWESHVGRGREELLDALVNLASRAGWPGDFHAEWETYDVELCGTPWHRIRLWTATEELGDQRRFTRVRCAIRPTMAMYALSIVLAIWTIAACFWAIEYWAGGGARSIVHPHILALAPAMTVCGGWALLGIVTARSVRRCRDSVRTLVSSAAAAAGLDAVNLVSSVASRRDSDDPEPDHEDGNSDDFPTMQVA